MDAEADWMFTQLMCIMGGPRGDWPPVLGIDVCGEGMDGDWSLETGLTAGHTVAHVYTWRCTTQTQVTSLHYLILATLRSRRTMETAPRKTCLEQCTWPRCGVGSMVAEHRSGDHNNFII